MRLADCHNFHDFRRLAERRLPGPIFNYIDGGADDEVTMRRNTAAFEDCDLVPSVLQGVSEALRFAQASDLDLEKVFEAISGGAASSWQMLNRWSTMSDEDFDFGGFKVDWMRKDLGLAIEEASSNGAALPAAALVDQFYADVQAMGGGRNDMSALLRRLPK